MDQPTTGSGRPSMIVRKPVPQTTVANASTHTASSPKERFSRTDEPELITRSPLFQIPFSWLIAILTVVTYSLTIVYAVGNAGIFRLPWVTLEPTRAITVLRSLSEVTTLLLVSLVNNAAERLQWMLLARKRGVPLPGFLSLGSGTGNLGLLKLLFRRTHGARLRSLCRIIFLLSPPVASVILLSQLDIVLVFHTQDSYPVAAGVGKFNVSYAELWQTITPTIITTDFSSLLQNTQFAYPVLPVTDNLVGCIQSTVVKENSNVECGSSFFLHGGIKLVRPWPTVNNSEPNAPIYTLQGVSGLHFDFQPLVANARFDGTEDCIVIGRANTAIQICISSSDSNTINSKFLQCPSKFRDYNLCLNDTSWQSSTGWTGSLRTYARRGTVHLSRNNLTTLAITNLSTPQPILVPSAGLLAAFNTTFNSGVTSIDPLVAGPFANAVEFMTFLTVYLDFSETSSPTYAEADSYLRNFLVSPLFYFQPTYLSDITYAAPLDEYSILEGLPPEHYIQASFATSAYQLRAAKWTVWTYICIMAPIILLCMVILVLGSLSKFAGGIPETTAWPALDFVANSRSVPHSDEGGESAGDLVEQIRDVKKASGSKRYRLLEKIQIGVKL